MNTQPLTVAPILVTGATGFIGRAFLRECAQRQWPVLAVVRRPPSPADASLPGVTWTVAELNHVPPTTLASCRALVHLAAAGVTAGGDDWAACLEVNVTRSLALWRATARTGIRRFIICGSCFEYGRSGERYERIPTIAPLEPVTAYAASKAAATTLALGLAATEALQLTVLRPFHVYGEGEAPGRFWPSLRQAALGGQDFPMTSGEQVRDFTPVDFVAGQFAAHLAGEPPAAGQPVIRNVGTGTPRTLREFAAVEWRRFQAHGRLLPGALPMRPREVLRYVPEISPS